MNLQENQLTQKEMANLSLEKANACLRQLQFSDGIAILQEVLEKIDDPSIQWVLHFNIGSMYSSWGKYSDADNHFKLAEQKGCKERGLLYHNIGLNHKRSLKYKEAIKYYRKGLKVDPNNPSIHNNLATCLLLLGEWDEGFKEWEWRLLAHHHSRNIRKLFHKPDWDGTPGKGTILIYNEQGRGDLIQYGRYIPLIKEYGYKTTLIVKEDMMDLMTNCGATHVLPAIESTNPNYDLVCSVNSLPHLIKTTINTIPDADYLRPKKKPPVPAKFWKKYDGKTKIGICWADSKFHGEDIYRSVCNAQFSVFNREKVQLFSVQKKDPVQSSLVAPNYTNFVDMEEYIKTMNDVACILQKMDLVITVDTSIAHLAASLGILTWVMVPVKPDYRWMLKSNTTPWYKTMQLYRQKVVDDWNTPFAAAAKDLKKLVK